MGVLRQSSTLVGKDLRILAVRSWFSTYMRAFIAPIIYTFFIAYAKNLFIPPSNFGIGSSSPVRSLENALDASAGGRDTVVFVNNGHTGGPIEAVINRVAGIVVDAGKNARIVDEPDAVLSICPSSLRGVTTCFAAAEFLSSPSEGLWGFWNYTLRVDSAFGEKIYVEKDDNDAEIYVLPLQKAIDSEIAAISGTPLPTTVDEYPFTSETNEERDERIRELFMDSLINVIAVAFLIGIIGVTYQLTGHMAAERESGLSQLIEAMTPNRKQWHTQAARLLALHLSSDILYLPGWVIMSFILWRIVFPGSSVAIPLSLNILAGLSLTSFSIFGASFFRRAQLSGISVTIVSALLAIIAQVTAPTGSAAVAILSLLFPPMNYTFALIWVARWERKGLSADLTSSAPESPWQVPGIVFWIFLILQILLFPVLGAVVERRLHGAATKQTRKMDLDSSDSTNAVTLSSFSKHYVSSWWRANVLSRIGVPKKEDVLAVNDISFTALRGQILVLLGANGSGKSTTLDAIAGLNSITSGTIQVDGTGGLGLCPQKNVMWDELTVYEQVAIFNKLKVSGKPDSKAVIHELIRACDLEIKMNAKARTLSGGQKRKLQLALMFTGGSRVCCVDEVSSGLDPISRRKMWDILLAERGRRTLLLTTHFLDEADILSDRIVILSKGQLKAEGSAVELKYKYGGGYRLYLPIGSNATVPSEFDRLQQHKADDQVIYYLDGSADAARFVKRLDDVGIDDYQIHGPTVEDVFLKLAEEIAEEQDISDGSAPEELPEPIGSEMATMRTESKSIVEGTESELLTGNGTSVRRQIWILFRKRLTILRRNSLPYYAAIVVPIVAAGFVTLFLKDFDGLSCSLASQSTSPDVYYLANPFISPFIRLVVGPFNRVPVDRLARLLHTVPSNITVVETLDDFNSVVASRYDDLMPGGIFLGEGSSTPLFAYLANWHLEYSALTQNLFDSVLSNVEIVTGFSSFALPFGEGAGDSLQMVLYFGLAMALYPGFFALYPTIERLRNVRSLQYSNGLKAPPLWLAYLLFDSIFVLLVSVVAIIIFVETWDGWYAPGYLFVVFVLYGFTSILLAYVVSLLVTTQLAAFAFTAGGQAGFVAAYFFVYLVIITYSAAADIDYSLTLAHFTFALVTPAGNLLRALFLTLNEFSVSCDGRAFTSYPGDIKAYGGPILYLIAQAALLFGVLLWWDSGWKPRFLVRSTARLKDKEEVEVQEPELREEVNRVRDTTDGLRALHLWKAFGRNVVVEDVTFGVKRGEVFALLGPNGAGKSTTISLIRGDLRPSGNDGDITVEGTSVLRRRAEARTNLGVCPQFDAMDQMTVLEHLRFYAQARGVSDVDHNVARIIAAVGLEAYKSRMASKLSGGNKRKLSLAVAIMGNPSVLLLDEPSSGMDAAAKRVMWKTLGAVSKGRSLVITTHSMEEADALANRAGIMAKKMLALGTVEELRRKYGDAYHVHLVHKQAPHTEREEMERLRSWIVDNIPGAQTEEAVYHGQLRFTVPNAPGPNRNADRFSIETKNASSQGDELSSDRNSAHVQSSKGIAALFNLLETNKERLNIEYYSVSQTTLDQIFLTIVNKHNIEEEGHERDAKVRSKRGEFWKRLMGRRSA